MKRGYRRNAFTLIELLTVMAIITLLIGILTPALGAARDRARQTAVRAQLNAMEVGLESFHGDEGKYPYSNPVLFANNQAAPDTEMGNWEVGLSATPLQGAHLLVDALVGRDFLGYDPKPTSSNPSYDRWDAGNDRRQPYIPVDGVDVTSLDKPPEDGFGRIPNTLGNPQPLITGSGTTALLCRVFRDKFGWPILYYRANPAANQNMPIIQTTNSIPPVAPGDGVYDGGDNRIFTGSCPLGGTPAGGNHKICDADKGLAWPVTAGQQALQSKFAEFIRSIRATTYDTTVTPSPIVTPRPVKADRFILLSAGKDGIYGNLDDVGNFAVLSVER